MNKSEFPYNSFARLSEIANSLSELRTTEDRVHLLVRYFSSLDKNDLRQAVIYLLEGPFRLLSDEKIKLGPRILSDATVEYCRIDYEKVFKPCREAVGNSKETIKLLLENIPINKQKGMHNYLTLNEINEILNKFLSAKTTSDKKNLLHSTWKRLKSDEISAFLHLLSNEPLIHGNSKPLINKALAEITHQQQNVIRERVMLTGSHSKAIDILLNGLTGVSEPELEHSLPFMLASNGDLSGDLLSSNYIAEEFLPGIRAQLLIRNGNVSLFDRRALDITRYFPDVKYFFETKLKDNILLDGQLILLKNDEIYSSRMLKKTRMQNKPTQNIIQQSPVYFIPFDILYCNGKLLFKETFRDRRFFLSELKERYQIPLIREFDIDVFNLNNSDRNSKGIFIKKNDSEYIPGVRSDDWVKISFQKSILSTVLLYAYREMGKNEYNQFTMGVRVNNDDRYFENFVPIGRLFLEEQNPFYEKLKEMVPALIVEKFGPTLALSPEIVLQVECTKIISNNRTKAKYQIQDPQLIDIQEKSGISLISPLSKVEEIYFGNLNRKRKVTEIDMPFYI